MSMDLARVIIELLGVAISLMSTVGCPIALG